MAKRRIEGLVWARQCERPSNIPVGRPRGAKAQGLRYEKSLAANLPEARRGLWFEFEDRRGRGVCQTDLVFVERDEVVVCEVKYSWTIEGHWELERLYLPVVAAAVCRNAMGLVVTKRIVGTMPREIVVVGSLDEALREVRSGRRVVWHWNGIPALVTLATLAA